MTIITSGDNPIDQQEQSVMTLYNILFIFLKLSIARMVTRNFF